MERAAARNRDRDDSDRIAAVDDETYAAALERALERYPLLPADAPADARRIRDAQRERERDSLLRGWTDPQRQREMRDLVERMARAAAQTDATGEGDSDAPHLTDLGNARRLVRQYGADIRYCSPRGGWFVWDGCRWRLDETGEVMRGAKEIVLALYSEVKHVAGAEAQRAFVKHALRSQDEPRLRAMVTVATTEAAIAVASDVWDRDPWVLNVANGTLDLRTGTLRSHRREDYLTKLAPVTYDLAARLELWETFLRDATGGDSELADFLQRYVGYTLTGSTAEEKLALVLGPEATGKSTLLEALKAALGDYAVTADFESFLKQPATGRPRNDLARLAGARLVISIEVEDGKVLAEGLVKTLTGGDTVAARLLYREFFEYVPQFKLWLAANHAPKVRDDDGAMWRRILRVPFRHTVPEDKRNKQVKAKLRDPAIGGPAILAWAVAGCLAWQRDGLKIPAQVTAATAQYREDMDPLREFIDERCVIDANAWATSEALWTTYTAWAKGERWSLSRRAFGDRLTTGGWPPVRGRGGVRIRHGIGLSESGAPEPTNPALVTHGDAQNLGSDKPPTRARVGDFFKTACPNVTASPGLIDEGYDT